MTIGIIAASAFCAGLAGGFLLAVAIACIGVRRDRARMRSHDHLLDECSWYYHADRIHFGE